MYKTNKKSSNYMFIASVVWDSCLTCSHWPTQNVQQTDRQQGQACPWCQPAMAGDKSSIFVFFTSFRLSASNAGACLLLTASSKWNCVGAQLVRSMAAKPTLKIHQCFLTTRGPEMVDTALVFQLELLLKKNHRR